MVLLLRVQSADKVGSVVPLFEVLDSVAVALPELSPTTKPVALLEVTETVTLLRSKVSMLPEAQVVGVVIETDKNSLTLTRKVSLDGLVAVAKGRAGKKTAYANIMHSKQIHALGIFFSIILL